MSTIERQPRESFRKKQAPIGGLAVEWGERIETSKTIARGGKPIEPASDPTDQEKQSAVYETLNQLGGDADWQEIARYIQSRWGFVLDEKEINALRARWGSLDDTVRARPAAPAEQPAETIEDDPPSESHHSPDR